MFLVSTSIFYHILPVKSIPNFQKFPQSYAAAVVNYYQSSQKAIFSDKKAQKAHPPDWQKKSPTGSSNFDLSGWRLRARGGRFFKEKAPQKPFWKRFFWRPMGGVRTWSAHAGGGAPSICRWQRPSAVGVSSRGPFFFGECVVDAW